MIKVNISNHIVCDSSEAAEPRDAHNPCVGLSNQTHGLPNICGTLVPIACKLEPPKSGQSSQSPDLRISSSIPCETGKRTVMETYIVY